MAEFCFRDKLMAEKRLLAQYGNGYTIPGNETVHCYVSKEQGLYVQARTSGHGKGKVVETLFVSQVPSCPKAHAPKTAFPPFRTREGVGVGDPIQKVLDTYGQPNDRQRGTGLRKLGIPYQEQVSTAPFGDEVLVYSPLKDELLTATFYLRDGKVSAMEISASE